MSNDKKCHFVVIVLGDVGRSPRMQYHAVSLLEEGHIVSLVGYEGEKLIPALAVSPPGFNVVRFSVPAPESLRKFLPVYLVWRIISLCVYLLHSLVVLVPKRAGNAPVDCFLVQNPPAMPLLAVVHFYCFCFRKLRGTSQPTMVIDWHNLGYTMISHPIFSKLARLYEERMAPKATAHLCVTQAMKDFLATEFQLKDDSISIVYDCPPALFRPISCEEQHKLLTRLHSDLCQTCTMSWHRHLDTSRQTLFTEFDAGTQQYLPRKGRPALVVSSTSWTPDEDFGILLDAALTLDRKISDMNSSLRVLIVVTGKGPQKEYYLEKISRLNLQNVAIGTLWLEPADYPKLLACADLGVSLHTSTSGIDLPMKVLDLFGCRVPVCAIDFRCLSELVVDDENGKVFSTGEQLCAQILSLVQPLEDPTQGQAPHCFGDLKRYSNALEKRKRWTENWKENAHPTLIRASS